mmetsp:Transcript_14495/g.26065  ORF Transcript_14495/g.26065 Transcript_14495/m.26065 type:complete len:397 (+) Transcript_14495:175-1365(+)|eukprot:CAMPEP_0197525674 /NCGR_PEP_ID=MMETSP1318-20131121/13875_1 /TAXON_ID=552666 /ORGANISM="Partenskyella glossopodia, Strain RCC365" /LENGTH=396 /DNA_ID=CAMNT_0043079345 /DNA_START=95 /DNA_END=1285 /DNA_ORIENTATION=-
MAGGLEGMVKLHAVLSCLKEETSQHMRSLRKRTVGLGQGTLLRPQTLTISRDFGSTGIGSTNANPTRTPPGKLSQTTSIESQTPADLNSKFLLPLLRNLQLRVDRLEKNNGKEASGVSSSSNSNIQKMLLKLEESHILCLQNQRRISERQLRLEALIGPISEACQRMEKFATKDEKGFKMCYAEISAIRESTKNSIREAKESVETQDSRINMLEKLLNAITDDIARCGRGIVDLRDSNERLEKRIDDDGQTVVKSFTERIQELRDALRDSNERLEKRIEDNGQTVVKSFTERIQELRDAADQRDEEYAQDRIEIDSRIDEKFKDLAQIQLNNNKGIEELVEKLHEINMNTDRRTANSHLALTEKIEKLTAELEGVQEQTKYMLKSWKENGSATAAV